MTITTEMNDIDSILEQVIESAKSNSPEARFISIISIDSAVRQGDIYVHRVSDDFARGDVLNTLQLVEGTSKGSRHCVSANDADGVTVFSGQRLPYYVMQNQNETVKKAFMGPLIKSTNRFTIEHPEHAHICLPAGTYQVSFQVDARTMKRVLD